MNFRALLKDEGADIEGVARWLDRTSPDARIDAVFGLGRAEQRRLFQLAAQGPAVSLAHFVPDGVDAGCAVHHRGKNTLPLPRKHKLFEKRFCRAEDGSGRLFGYNQCASTRTVGPGYFVALPTAPEPAWHDRGAVVVDYFQVPDRDAAVPSGWPRIVDNARGLSRFVYNGTRDFMRRVSEHVSIGAAFKGERPLDHYFVLVRQG